MNEIISSNDKLTNREKPVIIKPKKRNYKVAVFEGEGIILFQDPDTRLAIEKPPWKSEEERNSMIRQVKRDHPKISQEVLARSFGVRGGQPEVSKIINN